MYRKRKTYIHTITYVRVRTYTENEISARGGGEKCLENSQMQTQMQMPEPVAELVSGALHGSFHRQFAQESHKYPNVKIVCKSPSLVIEQTAHMESSSRCEAYSSLNFNLYFSCRKRKRTMGIDIYVDF